MFENVLAFGLMALCHWTEGVIVCSVTCEEGEYCFRDECRVCPEGSYIEKPVHQMTSCIPWTTKPSENFVVDRNGSSTSDILWKCQNGYVQYSADKCIRIATLSYNSTTTVTTSRTLLSAVINTTVVSNNSKETENGTMMLLLLIVPGFVVIILILCKKIKVCFSAIKSKLLKLLHNNEQQIEIEGPEKKLCLKTESHQEALHSDASDKLPAHINYSFFYKIIKQLSVDDAEKFLKVLDDPSGNFHADIEISFQRVKSKNLDNIFTESCMIWAQENLNVDHEQYVNAALKDIGRSNIKVKQQLPQDKTVCMNVNEKINFVKDNFNSSNDEDFRLFQNNEREELCVRRLWYFLAGELDGDGYEQLVYQLPNDDKHFNTKNFFDQKLNFEHENLTDSFVDTLDEWHLRNPNYVVTDCISTILSDIKRDDIVQLLICNF